jgi:hypothetical protein
MFGAKKTRRLPYLLDQEANALKKTKHNDKYLISKCANLRMC